MWAGVATFCSIRLVIRWRKVRGGIVLTTGIIGLVVVGFVGERVWKEERGVPRSGRGHVL